MNDKERQKIAVYLNSAVSHLEGWVKFIVDMDDHHYMAPTVQEALEKAKANTDECLAAAMGIIAPATAPAATAPDDGDDGELEPVERAERKVIDAARALYLADSQSNDDGVIVQEAEWRDLCASLGLLASAERERDLTNAKTQTIYVVAWAPRDDLAGTGGFDWFVSADEASSHLQDELRLDMQDPVPCPFTYVFRAVELPFIVKAGAGEDVTQYLEAHKDLFEVP